MVPIVLTDSKEIKWRHLMEKGRSVFLLGLYTKRIVMGNGLAKPSLLSAAFQLGQAAFGENSPN